MDPLRVSRRLLLPAEELSVAFARSGGPGGQNVNKIESKVVLRFLLERSAALSEEEKRLLRAKLAGKLTASGELLVQASRYRERARNLEDARERLARILREALATRRKRRPTRPTRGSIERRLTEKRQRAETKQRRRPDRG